MVADLGCPCGNDKQAARSDLTPDFAYGGQTGYDKDMATVSIDENPVDVREQTARIDKMQAEIGKPQIEIQKLVADAAKIRQETRLAPASLILSILGAGGALFAACAAFVKLLG